MNYLIEFIVTFSIVSAITPVLMKIFHKLGFTDKPTKRKKHKRITPLCGGLAMYIGFFISYFIWGDESKDKMFWIFIGSTLIIIIGLVDDYYKSIGKEFKIMPRLVVQILAAILIYNSGISFTGFTNPLTGMYVELSNTIQFVLTITWIFGVTTVINWSDGMDGLAGSISIVASITFFIAAIILNQNESATMSIILGGSVLGFLLFNRYPAKVFMGDSGANFLGFILSIIALDGAFKQATVLSVVIPILILAVPIFDNLFVVVKRFLAGQPVYQADRRQIHFRLQRKGLNPNQIVGFVVAISIFCSLISILLLFYNHQ